MEYTIDHSSIAGALYVTRKDGQESDCFYISESRPVQVGVSGTEQQAEERFKALPMEVRAAVNRQFGEVFSLPLGSRGAWVFAQMPFIVNISEEPE